MATVQTLINRALRLGGQLAAGASPTADETADALTALNAMLDSWRNEKLMCYAIRDESISLSSGNATRTIGPTGNLVSTRPVEIEAAYIVVSGSSYGVTVIDEEQYAAIPDKTATSNWPDRIYYQPSMPDGTIYNYPVPNASSTLHILTRTPVLAFSTAGDTVTLPPGWEEALTTNLCIAILAEYEREPKRAVISAARAAKSGIKRVNSRPFKATTELAHLFGNQHSNIITDQP